MKKVKVGWLKSENLNRNSISIIIGQSDTFGGCDEAPVDM